MSLSGRISWIIRHHPFIIKIFKRAVFIERHAVMFVTGRLKGIDENKVVFSSFDSSAYNDNPRYISEALHAMAPEVTQVWLLRKGSYETVKLPDYAVRAHAIGLDGLTHLATARAWVDNGRKNVNHLFRPKRQIYFNTWHGDRGFKRVGKDNDKEAFEPRLERLCTAMIAGSRFGRGTYRTAFEFKGRVLMDGCPRNDLLVRDDPEAAAAFRRAMGLDPEAKLLVYAPTYRSKAERKSQSAEMDIPRALDFLERTTAERWLCLMRLHYLSPGIDAPADDRIIDMCAWPEMAEILAVSDMLITDYSSCAGDFILRDKPAILYQSDIEDYKAGSRELYFEMETAPFMIAHTMEEFEAIVGGLTEASVKENCGRWREFFGVTETGHAAEASARFILNAMSGIPTPIGPDEEA